MLFLIGLLIGIFLGAVLANKQFRAKIINSLKQLSEKANKETK
jgi:uncharacterized protein YneF (UPF0154 family)